MKFEQKLVLFSLFVANLVDQPAPEVQIEQGIVSGIISNDGSFLQYIGIPYATVNSSNRFQAPLPAPKWNGIYKATEEYICPQEFGILGVFGEEDCLKINVYVPAAAERPLAVMVYVHGGAFTGGSGGKFMYGPEFIVKQNVILVTFNYRLGILGFLCLGIKEAPGNAGIKDQIAALKWIKKNIAAFGGDPDNITVFGESAGATSVSILLASETTNGLFNRAIVQSGSSISNWGVNRTPVKMASLIAQALGHNSEDPKELYDFFSKTPYKNLIQAKPKRSPDLYLDVDLLFLLPCVERKIPKVDSVLNDLPYNLLNNKPKNISVIYGATSKEGYLFIGDETEKSLEERNDKYVFSSDLIFPCADTAEIENKKLKKFYFGEDRISMKNKMIFSDLYGHLFFEIPPIIESEILLNNIEAPIYNYVFNYSGGRNLVKWLFGFTKEPGACHGDDILYLFTSLLWPWSKPEDQIIINWMTKMWTNFAKTGDPTPPLENDLPIWWKPSKKGKFNFLYIEDKLRMGEMLNPEAYRLWKDIYTKYRRKDLEYFH